MNNGQNKNLGLNADGLADAFPQLLTGIVETAKANQANMDGTTAPVKAIIDAGDIVFAVWPEPINKCGFGLLILKGDQLLRECFASGQAVRAEIGGIICACYEEAVAADQVLGVHDKGH